MALQWWILGQMTVDLVILVFLVGVLRFYKTRQVSLENFETAAGKAEQLLAEMRQIGAVLEENLNEKKELTRNLLNDLDKRLKEVKEAASDLQKMGPLQRRGAFSDAETEGLSSEKVRKSVKLLYEKGLSQEEIAAHLGLPIGELELMLKLQGHQGGT